MATVTPIANKDAFFAALEKSAVLSVAALAKAREVAEQAEDAKSAARQLVKAGLLTKWQAGQLLHGYYVLTIGKYNLLDQLASGETGRVYLAEHAQMERRHALKILSRRHASQPEVLKRFLSDAERLCKLEHRNLSHIYDVNQDGERYYLVMELVEGQDLGKRVAEQGPLSAADAVSCVRQAADGLAHAHEQQVFHGDLKPANLVIDAAGNLKITDIGQAKLVAAPPSGTEETAEVAALAGAIYRSPELRAGGRVVDARCDVYSLGAVLCYLLSGKAAPNASAARQGLEAQGVSAELVAVVTRMMADDPAVRDASMTDVAASLAGLAPAQAAGDKAAAPPPKKTRKPLVAKPITDAAPAAAASPAPSAAKPEGEPAPSPADPFAGFAVGPAARGKGPKAAKPSLPTVAVTPATKPASADSPAVAKKSRLPLILGAAIGGGVLVLAGIAVIVILAINWAGKAANDAVADAKDAINKAAVEAVPADSSAESNPAESNPAESNPELNPLPAAAPPVATPQGANPGNPLTPPSASIAPPMPAPVAPMPMPQPMPAPMPEPAPVEPAPAPAPETKPEPEKPTPPANPFAGFVASVTLPKLPASTAGEAPAEALAPLALGPCVVDDKALVIIQLKGGDGAIRGGKQKFEIAAAQGGTALRDWEISLTGGTANVIAALLSVKDNQLMFQWTPEGAKQAAAPLLCNCGLHLSAGPGQHDLALRTPIKGEPLVVALERGGSTVKWEIDLLPDPKKIFLEIAALEGGFLKHKFKERQTLEGSDRTEIWTGSEESAMPLGLRIDSTVSTTSIQVKSSPQYHLPAMKMRQPKALVKKELGSHEKQIDQSRLLFSKQIEIASKAKGEAAERQANLSKVELDKVNQADDQLTELKSLIENLDGKGQIHFRVYYQTEDGPIDLIVTGEGLPKEEKKEEN